MHSTFKAAMRLSFLIGRVVRKALMSAPSRGASRQSTLSKTMGVREARQVRGRSAHETC